MSPSVKKIIVLGIMLACWGGIYMCGRYIWLSQNAASIQVLISGAEQNESMIAIKNIISDNKNSDFIINKISSCYELNDLSNSAMMNIVISEKNHTIWIGVLFFGFAIMFGFLGYILIVA